jgi:hypothetical protein
MNNLKVGDVVSIKTGDAWICSTVNAVYEANDRFWISSGQDDAQDLSEMLSAENVAWVRGVHPSLMAADAVLIPVPLLRLCRAQFPMFGNEHKQIVELLEQVK